MGMLQKIRRELDARGLTQDAAERLSGLPRGRISKWFNGQGEPHAAHLYRLSRTLGRPIEYFLDDDQQAPAAPLTGAEKQALKMVRAMKLSEEEVIERLTTDPRAPVDLELESPPKSRRNRRA